MSDGGLLPGLRLSPDGIYIPLACNDFQDATRFECIEPPDGDVGEL